ncbi:MAG: fabG1 [Nitrososphaeraceae archaeon]|nr:fabG1 [Nitrososphaeraceae archaeon]
MSDVLQLMKLKGKVAIVTGAGGGVGKSITQRLISEGSKVVLIGRQRNKLMRTIAEVGDDNKNVLPVTADITKEAEVLNAIEQALSSFDTVDILINNAGIIYDPTPFHLMTDDQWTGLINTNLLGTFRTTKAVLPIMIDRKGGCIVNISSLLGMRSIPNVPFSVYGVTKAGVIMFTKSTIRSPMIEPYLQDENAKKLLESSFPLRRIGEPDDISSAVVYFCSDDAKWITGTILTVDGGISAKQ